MHVKTQKTSYKKTVFTHLPKIVMFVMFRNVEKCDKTIKQIPLYYLRFHKKNDNYLKNVKNIEKNIFSLKKSWVL